MLFKWILFWGTFVAIVRSDLPNNSIKDLIKQYLPFLDPERGEQLWRQFFKTPDRNTARFFHPGLSNHDMDFQKFINFVKLLKNNRYRQQGIIGNDWNDNPYRFPSISDRFYDPAEPNKEILPEFRSNINLLSLPKEPIIQKVDENNSTKVNEDSCILSETYVGGERKCRSELIFHDNFDKIDKETWTVENIFADAPDYEFSLYVDFPDTLQVLKSILVISPGRTENLFGQHVFTEGLNLGEKCTGRAGAPECEMHPEGGFIIPKAASARLNTHYKFSFKYGKVEIRAKLPAGDWLYPILYLNPSAENYGKYYESGQIRMAFIEGNQNYSKILKGGVVLGDSKPARNYYMRKLISNDSWADSFHKYQVEWKPDTIIFSVDDFVYGKIDPPEDGFSSVTSELSIPNAEDWKKGSKLAPFDKEMYLQFGVGIGGLNFPDRKGKPWKNRERLMMKKFYDAKDEWRSTWDEGKSSLKIDYVKVWAL